MYKCQNCNTQQIPGIKQIKIPVQFRNRFYPHANGTSVGKEIVKEVIFCPDCAENTQIFPGVHN
jgi:hypothetical protein